ncbi:hypothetical protein BACUNI_00187 [Bacteroides uniformis ATCC 8492]|uniref:Uncharacterized protein n=1 Tax=Bacteroides uniformis (strain ATCC 8492 / DSM 6597 / CCUG 4942 / CIP 103695 / JCM 5828 / KCTC 5204 / NCTC 13054 / VPI 0061) TaxID=411479 RepID=A0ABC9NHD8_BACUC|nr:hypothetical protein BACUNI_00187 [Bacteroides uniformis ATCC 8492]
MSLCCCGCGSKQPGECDTQKRASFHKCRWYKMIKY